MNNWFSIKVKYTKQLENGTYKRVSEIYLIAALSFTDAEARIYEELGSIIKGEFNVLEIKRYDVNDLFIYDDSDTFYLVKINFDSESLEGEKSKKTTQKFLVSADSVKEAHERLKESLSTLMVDFKIPSVVLSPIVEIFPFIPE
jgi:hypothetical protein